MTLLSIFLQTPYSWCTCSSRFRKGEAQQHKSSMDSCKSTRQYIVAAVPTSMTLSHSNYCSPTEFHRSILCARSPVIRGIRRTLSALLNAYRLTLCGSKGYGIAKICILAPDSDARCNSAFRTNLRFPGQWYRSLMPIGSAESRPVFYHHLTATRNCTV